MITLVLPYYGNPDMLRRHEAEWASYPDEVKANLSAIIVDDGSPEPARLGENPGFEVRLYRILQDIAWNVSGARNLALTECETDWVLMTDIDHLLRRDDAVRMLAMPRRAGAGYRPRRIKRGRDYKRHVLSMLLHRADYWRCGGMDEDFAGHYGEGTPFMRNFRASATVEDTDAFALTLFGGEDIEDARTNSLGRFGSEYDAELVPALRKKRRGPAYVARDPLRFEWERIA